MALFYIVLFVMVAIFFVAMLIYGTQEKSYEQAIEEQRNKNDLLLTSSTVKSESIKKETKKEKVKKGKEVNARKSKDKQNNVHISKIIASKDQNVNKTVIPKEIENIFVKDETSSQPDEVDNISTNLVEEVLQQSKDISKKIETKQNKSTENVVIEKTIPTTTASFDEKVDKIEQIQPDVNELEKKVKEIAVEQPKLSNKKNKRSISKGLYRFKLVSKELSFEDILELINSSYFSDDDITRLTDALLNRQADEQKNDYNWHKVIA